MLTREHCRFCNRLTTFNEKRCTSCGMPKLNAIVHTPATPSVEKPPRCPNLCIGRMGFVSVPKEIEPGRFQCSICGSVFEKDDFSFLDDRPTVNAMKKESRR